MATKSFRKGCSIWCDITSAQIKSSERHLKRYSNVYSEIENTTKYVTNIKFDINWQTRRWSPVNVLSALLLLGNHVTTAVRIKRTEQGSWYLNLHLLSWIPLQVIPARKHRQVMNRKAETEDSLEIQENFPSCIVCHDVLDLPFSYSLLTLAYFSAACAISLGTHSCLPLVTVKKTYIHKVQF